MEELFTPELLAYWGQEDLLANGKSRVENPISSKSGAHAKDDNDILEIPWLSESTVRRNHTIKKPSINANSEPVRSTDVDVNAMDDNESVTLEEDAPSNCDLQPLALAHIVPSNITKPPTIPATGNTDMDAVTPEIPLECNLSQTQEAAQKPSDALPAQDEVKPSPAAEQNATKNKATKDKEDRKVKTQPEEATSSPKSRKNWMSALKDAVMGKVEEYVEVDDVAPDTFPEEEMSMRDKCASLPKTCKLRLSDGELIVYWGRVSYCFYCSR
jgi:hypothetical protein